MPLEWFGPQAHTAILNGAARGLNRAATALMAESQARVPVDTTDLRRSAAVQEADAGNLESAVTYNTPYAVIQHERLDFYHPTDSNPGAQAKYLERPAKELGPKLGAVVAAEIRRATRS